MAIWKSDPSVLWATCFWAKFWIRPCCVPARRLLSQKSNPVCKKNHFLKRLTCIQQAVLKSSDYDYVYPFSKFDTNKNGFVLNLKTKYDFVVYIKYVFQ